jgi:hypothetical protein
MTTDLDHPDSWTTFLWTSTLNCGTFPSFPPQFAKCPLSSSWKKIRLWRRRSSTQSEREATCLAKPTRKLSKISKVTWPSVSQHLAVQFNQCLRPYRKTTQHWRRKRNLVDPCLSKVPAPRSIDLQILSWHTQENWEFHRLRFRWRAWKLGPCNTGP